MKIKKLNESPLVDKKVSALAKDGKPMYFTDDQLEDAKAKYPEYDFEETTIDKSLPVGQKAYIAKNKVTEDIDDSSELEANKMTIMPLAGLNADGFTVIINDAAGEELFKKEYRYGHNASYDRRFAQWAQKDHEDSIKYGWKNPRALKPYVADIVDELCIKYGIDKNSIEFVPSKNTFTGDSVTSDFVDTMKKRVYESKQEAADINAENITQYRDELQKYIDNEMKRSHVFFVDETFDGRLCVEINWGDWKHEHLACDWLVRDFFANKNKLVNVDVDVTEENGTDAYSAVHYYSLRPEMPVNDEPIELELMNEGSGSTEYSMLKNLYKHYKEFKDVDAQSGEIRDLIDDLEAKGIEYQEYTHKTDNGVTIFHEKVTVDDDNDWC